MRKKVLPLLIAIMIFLIPFGSASAYTGGLLQGERVTRSSNINFSGNNTNQTTDGNETTYYGLGGSGSSHIMWYKFPSPVSVASYQVLSDHVSQLNLRFYDSSNNLISETSNINTYSVRTNLASTVNNVSIVALVNTGLSTNLIYEWDVFTTGGAPAVKTEVEGVDVNNITKTSANLTWSNPVGYSGVTYSGAKIYLNDVLKTTTTTTTTSYSLSGLSPGTNYSVKVVASYSDGSQTTGITQPFTSNALSNITNIVSTIDYKAAQFSWVNPEDSEFTGVKILRDNVLIKTLDKTITTFSENITPSTNYTYKFVATYTNGLEANGVIKAVSTDPLPPVKKIQDIKVSTTYNRANLSWILPEQEGLKHVNIYRLKVEEKNGFFESIFSLSGTKVYAAAPNTKIFETNGTYFNDLTVQPESKYEYTLTTQTEDGRESEGVTVLATTKAEPEPVLVDEGYTIEPINSDYIFKWSEPTTGTVKILINGNQYKTVEASEKQIVIPEKDMKYTIFGDPDVSLIPISPYGKEGEKVTNPGGMIDSLKLPFDVTDLLQTIMGIIGLFGPFILLTLVIYYFKPIKNLVVRAAHRIRNGDVKNE
jgi:hypothetical protein